MDRDHQHGQSRRPTVNSRSRTCHVGCPKQNMDFRKCTLIRMLDQRHAEMFMFSRSVITKALSINKNLNGKQQEYIYIQASSSSREKYTQRLGC